MSILNSNDYKRGNDDGYRDGFQGVDKRYFKSGLSLKFALHGSKAIDTYNQGYNIGYEKGCYDRLSKPEPQTIKQESQNINKQTNTFSNNLKSSNMQRGIDGQIDLLQQMKDFLSNLTEQFEEITKTQEGFIRGLDSEGIDVKLLQRFEDEFNENKSKIQNLISAIDNEQIPYTEQVIRHLEDTPR